MMWRIIAGRFFRRLRRPQNDRNALGGDSKSLTIIARPNAISPVRFGRKAPGQRKDIAIRCGQRNGSRTHGTNPKVIADSSTMNQSLDQLFHLAMSYHQSGSLPQAEGTCEQILQTDPSHASTLHLLGVIKGQQGDHELAAESFAKAVAADPHVPDFHRNLGHACRSLGRLDEAIESYREALRLKPDSADSKLGLASSLHEQGKLDGAIESYLELVQQYPHWPEAHYNLATAFKDQERVDDAIRHYQEALRLKPDYHEALNNLSGLLVGRVKHQTAARQLRELVNLRPDFAPGHCNLGLVLMELSEFDEAIDSFQRTIELDPNAAEAYCGLANACIRSGKLAEASTHFEKLSKIESDPNYIALGEAAILERQGRLQEAFDVLQPLVEVGNDSEDFLVLLAILESQLGKRPEAIERLQSVYETSTRNQIRISFELGHMYDKVGDYDRAMDRFQRGNDLKAGPFDEVALDNMVSSRIEVLGAHRLAHFPSAEHESRLPVFIVGMPRSGTSLVEQILSSHPDVYGAGELMDIIQLRKDLPKTLETDVSYPRCMETMSLGMTNEIARRHLEALQQLAGNAQRVTDKMPYNFFVLGLIKLLFPRASIIHCVRDAVDTCLSCFFQNFPAGSTWCFDLPSIGTFYNQYQRMMRHWRDDVEIPMLEVCYEDLVTDTESHVRRILDHVGLDWSDQCLRFHESDRVVSTASYKQVREPIYTKSVARWKNYEKHLAPLLDALGPVVHG